MFKIFKKNKRTASPKTVPQKKEKEEDAAKTQKGAYSKEEEEVLKKRLRDLGYID